MSRWTGAARPLALALLVTLAGVTPATGEDNPGDGEVDIFLRPVTSFWETYEEGSFSAPRGIAYDRAHDEVWVVDTQNNRLALFDRDGMPLYSVTPGSAVREPYRLAIDGDRLLVLDNDHSRIAVLDWRGRYVGPLVLPGLPEHPVIAAIDVDAEGNLYVGENGSSQVIVYDRDRQVKNRFGARGDGKGEFLSIADIAVDAEHIVVVDHTATAVQVFDRHGNVEHAFGQHEMNAAGVSLPEAVAFDPKGRLLLVDALRHEIKLFTVEGRFLGRFGGMGFAPGNVAGPADIATDSRGCVYVAERWGNRAQVFQELERPHVDLPDARVRRERPPGS